MPKRQSLNILNLNEIDEQSLAYNLQKNDELKASVSNLQHIFRDYFFFTEEEVKFYINNICRESCVKAATELEQFFTAFIQNDEKQTERMAAASGWTVEEKNEFTFRRHSLAKSMVHDTIDLYFAETDSLSREFEDILREAKQYHIDPYRLAIKSNLKQATTEKFENTISALIEKKYLDKNTGEEQPLFYAENLKSIFDQCASIACKTNQENIEKILDLLNDFFYDTEKQAYVYDVREIIKSVPSILFSSAEKIGTTIEMLELSLACENSSCKTKMELLDRIKESPSILTVDYEKIMDFECKLANTIEKIINAKPFSARTKQEKDVHHFAEHIAESFAFDINHLTQISKLNDANFEKLSDVLSRYLGGDNAITCLQNMTILTTEPTFLDCFLAMLVKEEEISGLDLRQYFVESPYSALTKKDLTEISLSIATAEKKKEAEVPREKKIIAVKEMPKVMISNGELEKLQKQLNNKSKNLAQELLAKIKEADEERRKKEAEEKRLKYQQEKKEKQEKKALLKQKEKERYKIQQIARPVQPSLNLILEQKEETIEEIQRRRCSKIPTVKDVSLDDVGLRDFFRVLYEPIVKGFDANGYYPKDLPNFFKVCNAYELMVDTLNASISTHEQIKTFIQTLKHVTHSPICPTSENTIQNLTNPNYIDNSKTNIQFILDFGNETLVQTLENEKSFSRAAKLLNESDKRHFFSKRVNEKDNMMARSEEMQANLGEYITGLEKKAKEFFGPDYLNIFFPEQKKEQKHYLDEFISTVVTPTAFNSFEMQAYGQEYMCKVAVDLIKKGLMQDNIKQQHIARNNVLNHPSENQDNSMTRFINQNSQPISRFTIYEKETRRYGLECETISHFMELLFKIDTSLVEKLSEVSFRINKENKLSPMMELYYIESEDNHSDVYIDFPVNSDECLGMPPSILFPELYDYKEDKSGYFFQNIEAN